MSICACACLTEDAVKPHLQNQHHIGIFESCHPDGNLTPVLPRLGYEWCVRVEGAPMNLVTQFLSSILLY